MINRKDSLQAFVEWSHTFSGDEKGQAQIFLDRLFRAFGHMGVQEAGGVLEERLKVRKDEKTTTRFADLVLPGLVLIEMKKRGEDLRKHYAQAFDYWLHLVPNRPKYVILCNFDEFWIYELDYQLDDPRDKLRVEDLPKRPGPLAFLQRVPEPPVFNTDLIAVTKDAALKLSQLFNALIAEGRNIPREKAQRFIVQCMLALFAEDMGLLPKYTFTRIVEDCLNGENSYDLFLLLFHAMNNPDRTPNGRFKEVPYFNGGIFSKVESLQLTALELGLLKDATIHDWGQVRPAIFGTIFEGSLEKPERHQIGAHYTNEIDIQRIVQPVIARPWRARIEAATTAAELRDLQHELSAYQVLDPACGSGNFLYIAYREMKRLEKTIIDRLNELGDTSVQGRVSARQFWGFDIKPFAVELAKVTLMIARKLSVDELGLPENPLPLDNLDDTIRVADALFTDWPEFDACIGNPPYMGAKVLKTLHDVSYVNRVRAAFPDVPGMADYCVYWFRKAHDLMKPGARAGLVGTNTIRQNKSRVGGLDHIVANGGQIFEAVSSIVWEGEAAVSVSIACWSKGDAPYKPSRLWFTGEQYIELPVINSSLSANTDVKTAHVLPTNAYPKQVFNGQVPGQGEFVLQPIQAGQFIRTDQLNADVIFPFLTGRDLVSKPGANPSRYVIDLSHYDILEAKQFGAIFKYIEAKVLPGREAKAHKEAQTNKKALERNPRAKLNHDHRTALKNWWVLSRSRTELMSRVSNLSRYIVCSEVTKRPIFEFISPKIHPDHTLEVFTFDDDYSFGILQSNLHWKWFIEKCSTLTDRYRYTPESVFDTFPWPQQPTPAQVKAIALAGRNLHEYRRTLMNKYSTFTLRKLYETLETPGANPLADLHTKLDKAVMAAYGFNPASDVLEQLLALNQTVYAHIEAGESVTAPGIPPGYPNPADLVSEGCVQPREIV